MFLTPSVEFKTNCKGIGLIWLTYKKKKKKTFVTELSENSRIKIILKPKFLLQPQ